MATGACGGKPSRAGSTRRGASAETALGDVLDIDIVGATGLAAIGAGFGGTGLDACVGAATAGAPIGETGSGFFAAWLTGASGGDGFCTSRRVLSGAACTGKTTAAGAGAGIGAGGVTGSVAWGDACDAAGLAGRGGVSGVATGAGLAVLARLRNSASSSSAGCFSTTASSTGLISARGFSSGAGTATGAGAGASAGVIGGNPSRTGSTRKGVDACACASTA